MTWALFRKTPWSVAVILILSVSVFAIAIAPLVPRSGTFTVASLTTTLIPLDRTPPFTVVGGVPNCFYPPQCRVGDTATLTGTGHDPTGTLTWYRSDTDQCPSKGATGLVGIPAPDPGDYTLGGSWDMAAPGTYYFYAQYTVTSDTGQTIVVVTSACEPLKLQAGPTAHPLCPGSNFPSGFTCRSVYEVKFICNEGLDASAQTVRAYGLEPGFYQTDINIHNPSFSRTNLTLVEKFVIAMPQFIVPERTNQVVVAVPSPYVLRWVTLTPDAALRIDCAQILSYVLDEGAGVTAKGFVMIYSSLPTTKHIAVWAEYSAADSSGNLRSLDVVQIQPVAYVP